MFSRNCYLWLRSVHKCVQLSPCIKQQFSHHSHLAIIKATPGFTTHFIHNLGGQQQESLHNTYRKVNGHFCSRKNSLSYENVFLLQCVMLYKNSHNSVAWIICIVLYTSLTHVDVLYRWHKKNGNFWKPQQKLKKSKKKKIIDRNWTITTCLLRESNPNYQCLKITSCRWSPPPHMHSFTATTHFKNYVL